MCVQVCVVAQWCSKGQYVRSYRRVALPCRSTPAQAAGVDLHWWEMSLIGYLMSQIVDNYKAIMDTWCYGVLYFLISRHIFVHYSLLLSPAVSEKISALYIRVFNANMCAWWLIYSFSSQLPFLDSKSLLLKCVSGNVANTHRANHPLWTKHCSYFLCLCRAFVCFLLVSCFCSCYFFSSLLSISIFFDSVFPEQW